MSSPLDDETILARGAETLSGSHGTADAAERLGVLGLGAMGEPMARNLLAARGDLVVHARSPRQDLVAAGATWAASPRELAAQSDAILVMLPDLPELDAALEGPDGLLAGGGDLLLLIGSTSSPTGVRDLAARLADGAGGDRRILVVDCPVSGGVDGATAGTLSIMIGGDADVAARASALLAPCGTPVHLGPLGAGEVAKACNQLVVAATITALGEASELAARSGIDLDTMWTLLGRGYAGSNLLSSRKERLVAGDDSPSGAAKYMVKDLRFAADVASATGIHPALLPALRGIFDEIVDAGLGDRDLSVTRRLTADRHASAPEGVGDYAES
ncbi:NAD(P)-dependent oxidoreductase [Microbacterium flavum]|uniref:NAD(P)-dependent oxidoreductase n=1 Tax=Microbacterium flavum TaxID=415216 RepID=UPI0024AE5C73|nr:NAD(P)-dependent oxidoreductase [Microbacterium flavum]